MKNNLKSELYVHIPFCARKCDYCDFTSFVTDACSKQRYFEMLNKEIDMKADFTGKIPVESVFFGGGTPSLVDSRFIVNVLEHLRDRYLIEETAEISMEMNPNSISKDKVKDYYNAGINRVSIGLQSANNEELRALSRLHSYEEFLTAYDVIRNAGFNNVNVDIMNALPGQTVSSYEETLKKVLALRPEHISAYSLIIEEGTPFYERYPDKKGLPSEEDERLMYYKTKELLRPEGYERYEISNYSLEGRECRHNIGYWVRKPYIGFGLSAASLFDEKRHTTHGNLKAYLEGDFSGEDIVLSKKDQMEEFLFLGLRMIKGVSLKEFEDNFGKKLTSVYGEPVSKLTKENLIVMDDRLRLTDRGLDLANYCMAEFLLDE